MFSIKKDLERCASLPTSERVAGFKRIISRTQVEESLRSCRRKHRACPRLPGWFMVWYCIALGFFSRESYRQVFRWLQPFRRGATPGRSTLCEARKRIGIAPFRRLMELCVRLLGKPETPGAFYQGMRLMAIDGLTMALPDTPANDRAFGRPGNQKTLSAFPHARIVAMCEIGSHVLWRLQIKPYRRGEGPMAD